MPNLYLFTGENTFALREERKRWIGEFMKKFGEENVGRVDGSKTSVRELLDEVGVMPFLAEKRLVVCEGVPKATKEEMVALSTQIHPAVLLMFVDAKPDKRTAGVKELLNIAEVKEFPPIKGKQLTDWAITYARSKNAVLEPKAADLLLEYIGEDQDMFAQEIDKLSLLHADGSIKYADVEESVVQTDEGVIWKISDLLASGSRPEALQFARKLLTRGGDAYGLWAILLNMLKNLVAVSAAVEAGHTQGKEIADATGVHIFAVRSLQAHAKRAKGSALSPFLSWAACADKDLKTGVYRSTDEAPQELLALIDRFILRCP